MHSEDAFLEMIRTNPSDDGPRLVYADWLEERGQTERAEFIRVQCALPKVNERNPEYACLRAREAELLRLHEAEWVAEIRDVALEWEFWRGFVGRITIHPEALFDRGHELFRNQPIQGIRFPHARFVHPSIAHGLSSCDFLESLVELDLSQTVLGREGGLALFNSPYLRRLEAVFLGDADSSLTMATILATSTHLPQLNSLYFFGVHSRELGGEGLELIANSRHRAGLRLLHVNADGFTESAAGAIATSPFLTQLTHLHLEGMTTSAEIIGPRGAVLLADSANLSHLTSLALVFNRIGDAGVESLARTPHLQHLSALYLNGNGITDRGASELVHSKFWPLLESLSLQSNEIGDAGVISIANAPRRSALKSLWLSGNRISDAGVRYLIDSNVLENLEWIVLDGKDPAVDVRAARKKQPSAASAALSESTSNAASSVGSIAH